VPFDQLDPEWVAAGDTRNWFAEDPLLDWLDLYGTNHGFQRDNEDPRYDPRLDMTTFIFAKGREFEKRVVEMIGHRCQLYRPSGDTREERAIDTQRLVNEQVEGIYQGTLLDAENKVYGKPDLLVRSDILCKLCDCPPDKLGDAPHYRVIDVKFSNVPLLVSGLIGSAKKKHIAQLYLYNRMLGAIQGYTPERAYLIGRTYEQREERYENCLHMLAPAKMNDVELAQDVDSAIYWLRKVRNEGSEWGVLPEPANEWLRPHMGNDQDSPWRNAKKLIAEEIKEHTSLWQVGVRGRNIAIAKGIHGYDHPECCADHFGLTGNKPKTLQRILDVQKPGAPAVLPNRIETDRENWHRKRDVEFYVDFETVNDMNDRFDKLPHRGGQNLIYMIGCGHEEDGEWKFECFICDRMTEPCEKEQIDKWIAHMMNTCVRLGGMDPHVFHWSPHEKVSLTTHFESARKRHPDNKWPEPTWYDFLNKVVRPEPVTVKGAYAFGLKAVANAMAKNDLIATNWGSSRIDGMGAMLGGWACDEEAEKRGCYMVDIDLMHEIREYNEVDCKVMWEAINYLRRHH
jgi:hypothetical protein